MVKEGELVFLYCDEKTTFLTTYHKNQSFSTHKGNVIFPQELYFGDCIYSNTGAKFYVIKPTLADKMMKVKRKTTIVYPKEAGIILLELDVHSGSRVIEIGSGSGAFTILLSNIVGENGRVFSFERRAEHLDLAKKNFEKFKKWDNVEFILKDPATDKDFSLENIDSVFIDVPEPWTLIEPAHKALTGGGHLGTLSPNIEQIQQTVEEMTRVGFVRIRCLEVLTRGIRVKKNMTRPFDRMIGHTAYLLFGEKIFTNNEVLTISE